MSTQGVGTYPRRSSNQTEYASQASTAPSTKITLQPIRGGEHFGNSNSLPKIPTLQIDFEPFTVQSQEARGQFLITQVNELVDANNRLKSRVAELMQRNLSLEQKVQELSYKIGNPCHNQDRLPYQAHRSTSPFLSQPSQSPTPLYPSLTSSEHLPPPTYIQQELAGNPSFQKLERMPLTVFYSDGTHTTEQDCIEYAKELIAEQKFAPAIRQLRLAMTIKKDNSETSELLYFCEEKLRHT